MNDLIQVECYSGYTYAQEPRAFEWGGRRYEIKRIVKRWRTPEGPGFRVEVAAISKLQYPSSNTQTPIPKLVDLHYLEIEEKWTLTVQTNLIQEDQR